MNNLILAQVLGSAFGSARQRRRTGGTSGGFGGGLRGAAIGTVLAGMMRSRGARGARGAGGRGLLLAMMLPFAMRWVERNGGLGALIQRFKDKGYGRQVQSWVAGGTNEDIAPEALEAVVGRDEITGMSREMGVPEVEVKQSLAEVLPEMVNQLTPDGHMDAEADQVLQDSIPMVEEELRQAQREAAAG